MSIDADVDVPPVPLPGLPLAESKPFYEVIQSCRPDLL